MIKNELISAMLWKIVDKKNNKFQLKIDFAPLYHNTRDVLEEVSKDGARYYEQEVSIPLSLKIISLDFDTNDKLNLVYEQMVTFIEHIISNIENTANFVHDGLSH